MVPSALGTQVETKSRVEYLASNHSWSFPTFFPLGSETALVPFWVARGENISRSSIQVHLSDGSIFVYPGPRWGGGMKLESGALNLLF